MNFYTVGLSRCPCGKPAEVEVQGTGNVNYGRFCKRCGERKKRNLTEYWSAQSKEAQHTQVEQTRVSP